MFEATGRGTVFSVPGTPGARPPDDLAGEQKQPDWLADSTKSKEGFLALLAAKAHFLMLPKEIVGFLRDSSRVRISEAIPTNGAVAQTAPILREGGTLALEMRIPLARAGLIYAGHNLGRPGP